MQNSLNSLQNEIAKLIVDSLNLEDVNPADLDPKAPLFGEGLGLDSIDAIEIGAALSKRYHIKIKSQDEETEQHFNSVESLARFVEKTTVSKEGYTGDWSMDKNTMLEKLQTLLEDEFDIDRDKVTLDALLYEDLGLDSIDAVDLMAWIVKLTGKRMSPEDFRNVRTVKDVIDKFEKEFP